MRLDQALLDQIDAHNRAYLYTLIQQESEKGIKLAEENLKAIKLPDNKGTK